MKKVVSLSTAVFAVACGLVNVGQAHAANATGDPLTAAFIDCDSSGAYSSGDVKLHRSQLYPKGTYNILDTGAACGSNEDKSLVFPAAVKSDRNKNSVYIIATGSIVVKSDMDHAVIQLTSTRGTVSVSGARHLDAQTIGLTGYAGVKVDGGSNLAADYGIFLNARRSQIASGTRFDYLDTAPDASVAIGNGANLHTGLNLSLRANGEVSVGERSRLTASDMRFYSSSYKGQIRVVAPRIAIASSAKMKSSLKPSMRSAD